MTQYNTLQVKLSNSLLNKFKSGIKNGTEVTLKLSLNVGGDSNDENNFLHKLLLKVIRGTGLEFLYFITKLHSVFKTFKFLYFSPSHDLPNL